MRPFVTAAAAACIALAPLAPAAAQDESETAEARGLRIAQEAALRDEGFGDSEAAMTMTLRNRHGEESVRHIRTRVLEKIDDGDKSLSIFDRPRDVRGTALLTHTHKTGDDDQWLYLPALKRVKRIGASNRSGSFMGSEFSYEDLSSQEVEKFTYRWLRDEPCPGAETLSCRTIERYPVDEESGYTRQVMWMDRDEYRPWRIDFYDRKDALLKTLTFADYRLYADRHWRAHRMAMVNRLTGKSTDLEFGEYAFGQGLTDRDFDSRALSRAR